MTTITIPSRALVIVVGPAGCGKTTFIAKHFPATASVSADVCREMVSDSMQNQESNKQAFELFHKWIELRLSLGRLVVADATNVLPSARTKLRQIAATFNVPVIVIQFDIPLSTCLAQNAARSRFVPEEAIERHFLLNAQAKVEIPRELCRDIYTVSPQTEDYKVVVQTGVRQVHGDGFDIIGDQHGCAVELTELIYILGYRGAAYVHPQGRKLVFIGDATDRGPYSVDVLRIIQRALDGGHHAVMGNHDNKLMRALRGNAVKMGNGLMETWQQLDLLSTATEKAEFYQMLSALPYQLTLKVLDRHDVVVCHAGLPKRLVGHDNNEARNHAIYGEVDGITKPGEFPTRGLNYIKGWPQGGSYLVHGHSVVVEPRLGEDHNVFDIDTGCVFGGYLTAMRYPEMTFVRVKAKEAYFDKTYGSGAATSEPLEG